MQTDQCPSLLGVSPLSGLPSLSRDHHEYPGFYTLSARRGRFSQDMLPGAIPAPVWCQAGPGGPQDRRNHFVSSLEVGVPWASSISHLPSLGGLDSGEAVPVGVLYLVSPHDYCDQTRPQQRTRQESIHSAAQAVSARRQSATLQPGS